MHGINHIVKKEVLDMNNWKEIERGDVFIFDDENQELAGTLKSIREGNFGNKVYDIETRNGLVSIFGTTILDSKMENIKPEQEIKIVYQGEIKTKKEGRMCRDFKVFVKE